MEPKMEMRMEHKVERIAKALERIADALEKQNAGNQMVQVDGREIGRLVKAVND